MLRVLCIERRNCAAREDEIDRKWVLTGPLPPVSKLIMLAGVAKQSTLTRAVPSKRTRQKSNSLSVSPNQCPTCGTKPSVGEASGGPFTLQASDAPNFDGGPGSRRLHSPKR
jgi:hypothetical protein